MSHASCRHLCIIPVSTGSWEAQTPTTNHARIACICPQEPTAIHYEKHTKSSE